MSHGVAYEHIVLTRTVTVIVIVIVIAMVLTPVVARSETPKPAKITGSTKITEPAKIKLADGLMLVPQLNSQLTHNNNIFSDQDAPQASFISVVSPRLTLLLDQGLNKYSARYLVRQGNYASSPADDYSDQQLMLTGDIEADKRHKFDIGYQLSSTHEKRGSGLSEGHQSRTSVPIRYQLQQFDSLYTYGVKQAAMGIELGLNYQDKAYTNFSQLTQGRDFSNVALQATLLSRLSGKTRAFIELAMENSDYEAAQDSSPQRDSTVYNASMGARWQASAMLAGKFKLGYQQKHFSDNRRQQFTGMSWSTNIDWSPLRYSKFALNTSRKAKDTDSGGDYIDHQHLALSWQHQWQQRIRSQLSVRYDDRQYVGINRQDKKSIWSLQLNYDMRRWFGVELGAELTDNSSSLPQLNYDRRSLYLGFRLSL